MGIEENDNKTINLLDVQTDLAEEEPIEQVFSRARRNKIDRTIHRIRRSRKV
jgi:hypothetical protein